MCKLITKAVIREGVIKLVSKIAMKAAAISSEVTFTYSNPAGFVADCAQFGLETIGYQEIGKALGKWGNIGSALVTGVVYTGSAWPVGASIGALVGLGTWIIGEGVGEGVVQALS